MEFWVVFDPSCVKSDVVPPGHMDSSYVHNNNSANNRDLYTEAQGNILGLPL